MTFGPAEYELHDISTIPKRQGTNDLVIGLIGGGEVVISGEVVVEPLGLDGTITLDKLILESAWPALKPYFEFDLVGGSAGGRFDYSLELLDDGFHTAISDLDYRIESLELKLRDAETNILEVPLITIAGGHATWPEATVGAFDVTATGADAFLWIRPDGVPGWAALVPEETQVQVVNSYYKMKEALPWTIAVDRFEIKSARLRFEDRTFDDPLAYEVGDAELTLTDILTDPGSRWGLSASAMLFGEAQVSADGFIGAGPMRLETDVTVADFDLARFEGASVGPGRGERRRGGVPADVSEGR